MSLKKHRDHLILLGILGLLVLVAVLSEYFFADVPPGPSLSGGELTEAQEKAIDLATRLAELFIGWSIAIIGGAAVLLKLDKENASGLRRSDVAYGAMIMLLSVASIFFGHLGINLVERALALQQFPLTIDSVQWTFRYQYLTALGSVGALGGFAVMYIQRASKQ